MEHKLSIMERIIDQYRKPTGLFGTLLGREMNHGHGPLRHWGLSYIVLGADAIILDVGCGGGKGVQELAQSSPQGKVYGIDHSKHMVQLARTVNKTLIKKGQVEIQYGDVSALPFPENMFDLVMASESYYFWPNLIDDLTEIRRVLKLGGTLLIVNEIYQNEAFEKGNKNFARWAGMMTFHIHTPDETRDYLTKAGYLAVVIDEIRQKNWIAVRAIK